MKIAVGFACLVTVAVLEVVIGDPVSKNDNVTADDPEGAADTVVDTNDPVTADDPDVVADTAGVKNDLSQCEVARGECQSKNETCDGGELLEDDFYCGSVDKPYCCIPLGCVYGSTTLRNGAFIKRGCTKLMCEKGTIKKDDSECKNEEELGKNCAGGGGLILNEKCFFAELNNLANWTEARVRCNKLKFNTTNTQLKLASFAGISNTSEIPGRLYHNNFWTGGSDTAVEDAWKWVDGMTITGSGPSFHQTCLSARIESPNGDGAGVIKYTKENCNRKFLYICELPKDPISCNCIKKENGCILGDTNMPEHACQCKLSGEKCEGIVVKCKDKGSRDCIHPGIDFEHCRQGVIRGQGNCCGYDAATC